MWEWPANQLVKDRMDMAGLTCPLSVLLQISVQLWRSFLSWNVQVVLVLLWYRVYSDLCACHVIQTWAEVLTLCLLQIIKVEHITEGGDLLSKVDPYVQLSVRDRSQRTKTIWNSKNPEYDEVFNLIVDDLNTQVLTIELHDDDMGFNDPVSPPPPPPPTLPLILLYSWREGQKSTIQLPYCGSRRCWIQLAFTNVFSRWLFLEHPALCSCLIS